MTWVWCVSQNVKMNSHNAYQPVVLLTVSWNVIALLLHVVIVSIPNLGISRPWREWANIWFLSMSMSYWLHWWLSRVWEPYLFLQCKSKSLIHCSRQSIEWLLRTIRMLITKKLVWLRPARLLDNVFWTARMIVAAKLLVCQLSNQSTQIALARFVELIILFKA